MSTVTVKYTAESLEDIALKFDEEAKYEREQATESPHRTIRDRRYRTGRAESLEYAARILRQTTLGESA